MKLPIRVTFLVVEKLVDGAFALAMAVDRGIDAWKARKPKGLTFKDVQHIKAQSDAAAAKRSAKTVVLPRKP